MSTTGSQVSRYPDASATYVSLVSPHDELHGSPGVSISAETMKGCELLCSLACAFSILI